MNHRFFTLACLFGGLAVALGALGAHLLQSILPAAKITTFEIGVRYQFYHALALLAVAVGWGRLSAKWAGRAAWCFVVGVLLFSGSLYLLALSEVWGLNALRPVLGPLTPLGGVFFIVGWALLLLAGRKQ